MRAVGELAGAHAAEQIEVLVDAAAAIRRVLARLGQRAAMLADLVGRQRIDIGHALADQILGELIQLLVVVRRVVLAIVPVKPEPPHVVLDRIDVLDVFLDGIGVVEAEVAVAAEFAGDAEVEADRLGVPDVQVAVRLGRKARDDAAAVLSGGDVGGDDLANEVLRRGAVVSASTRVPTSDTVSDDQLIVTISRCAGSAGEDREDDQRIAAAAGQAVRRAARHDGEAPAETREFALAKPQRPSPPTT